MCVCAGVGPARAITLIREFKSIEEIIKKGKVRGGCCNKSCDGSRYNEVTA